MPHLTFAAVAGWLGVSLSFLATWYQFHRVRTVGIDGVSLTTWLQFVLMGAFWVAYGTAVHEFVIVAGSLFIWPMQMVIVARLSPWQHRIVVLRAVLFIGACSFVPTVMFGWSAGVYGTGVAMVANRIPQLHELITHRGDLGVSVGSWTVGAMCSAMWIAYYGSARLWAPLISTGAAMFGNVAIAVLAAYRHRQALVEAPLNSVVASI